MRGDALGVQRVPAGLGPAGTLAPASTQPQGGAGWFSDTVYITLHPSLLVQIENKAKLCQ